MRLWSLAVLLVVAACNAGDADPAPDNNDNGGGDDVVPVEGDDDGDGFNEEGGDCNDEDPTIHPGVAEVACDNIDNDCNGLIDDGVESWETVRLEVDSDGDGTRPTASPSTPSPTATVRNPESTSMAMGHPIRSSPEPSTARATSPAKPWSPAGLPTSS